MGSSVAVRVSGRKNCAFGGLLNQKLFGYALALWGRQRQYVHPRWVYSRIDVHNTLLGTQRLLLDQLAGCIVDGHFSPRCTVQLVWE
jgi:hypothetical protein